MNVPARPRRRLVILAAIVLLSSSAALLAQTRPPIPGVTGVKEPEGGGSGSDGVWAGVEKAAEGTRKLLGAIGIGGGEREATVDPLKTLENGATVVVRYYAKVADLGDLNQSEAQRTTEGRVIELDRKTGVIVVRLADRTTERLRVADRRGAQAAGDAAQGETDIVGVSYVDTNGDRILIPFRKVS